MNVLAVKTRHTVLAIAGAAIGAIVLTPGLSPLAPSGAAAAPSTHASCVGIEMASISPPGSSDEFPGGAPQLLHEALMPLDGPVGAAISPFAKLHEGSHEACDEAVE